jgi:glutaredoxin-related protein
MSRSILDQNSIHPSAVSSVGGGYQETINEVQQALAENSIVVVGMAQNPFCRKARQQLQTSGHSFCDLSYGSYFSQWHRRLAIKMWSGWPSLPMVFVNGVLVGGANELQSLATSGELDTLLSDKK